jgi:hypothetical protein
MKGLSLKKESFYLLQILRKKSAKVLVLWKFFCKHFYIDSSFVKHLKKYDKEFIFELIHFVY